MENSSCFTNSESCESDHYRPIAILPVLSKVYERLVLSQLLEYVELERLFQDTTSGYRKGPSTTTVLLRIRDDLIQAMKKGELTLIAFADFSKAFDTVDYSIVIRKLHAIGLSKSALLWILTLSLPRVTLIDFTLSNARRFYSSMGNPTGVKGLSYLSNRQQLVQVNDKQSRLKDV